MAVQLMAIGGTDYTNNLAQTLYQDSQTGTIGFDKPHVLAAEADIWLNQANAALAAAGRHRPRLSRSHGHHCLSPDHPGVDLDKMKLWLLCNLGRSTPYPQ